MCGTAMRVMENVKRARLAICSMLIVISVGAFMLKTETSFDAELHFIQFTNVEKETRFGPGDRLISGPEAIFSVPQSETSPHALAGRHKNSPTRYTTNPPTLPAPPRTSSVNPLLPRIHLVYSIQGSTAEQLREQVHRVYRSAWSAFQKGCERNLQLVGSLQHLAEDLVGKLVSSCYQHMPSLSPSGIYSKAAAKSFESRL